MQHAVYRCSGCHDHVYIFPHQLRGQCAKDVGFSVRETRLNDEILSLDVSELAHSLQKCFVASRVQRRLERTKVEKADAPDLALLLREGSERRCKSTCRKCHDQFPAIIHSLPLVYARLPNHATATD